jgi:hypothetical protein
MDITTLNGDFHILYDNQITDELESATLVPPVI